MRHSIGREARLCAWVECGTDLIAWRWICVVDAFGGDVFTRSFAALASGFEQIISAPDPTQSGEARAQDICAD